MGGVSGSDFRQVIDFIRAGANGTPEDPLPTATLKALSEVIPADQLEFFALRRADRSVLAHSMSEHWDDAPGTDEAIRAVGHQNPVSWRRWRPTDGALRQSGLIRQRALERLEFYHEVLKPNRVRDVLKVWLWSSPESVACLQLTRLDADFTQRDEDVLAILQRHLIDALEGPLAGEITADPRRPHLTRREAEIVTWAARGFGNEEIAAMLGVSRATIRKHLEHVYERLGVRSRAEAVWQLMATDPDRGNRPH
jgi:DNA-binding CsgD family transcriptional regulator